MGKLRCIFCRRFMTERLERWSGIGPKPRYCSPKCYQDAHRQRDGHRLTGRREVWITERVAELRGHCERGLYAREIAPLMGMTAGAIARARRDFNLPKPRARSWARVQKVSQNV
jgi:hypothetical protein